VKFVVPLAVPDPSKAVWLMYSVRQSMLYFERGRCRL